MLSYSKWVGNVGGKENLLLLEVSEQPDDP